jgi:thiol-disulfide isomerase/thioredoxin
MQKLIFTLFTIVLIGAGCATGGESTSDALDDQGSASQNTIQEQDTRSSKRAKVLDVAFQDYQGNEVTLADFLDKPLIVNSWAVWCPFCVKELPDFAKVQQELGDSITIIAINRNESQSKTEEFLQERGVRDGLTYWLDSGDKFYQTIGGFSMPETVLISRDGQIVDHKRGPMDDTELRKRIKDNFGI